MELDGREAVRTSSLGLQTAQAGFQVGVRTKCLKKLVGQRSEIKKSVRTEIAKFGSSIDRNYQGSLSAHWHIRIWWGYKNHRPTFYFSSAGSHLPKHITTT